MTRDDALKVMAKRTPVIYSGAGSLGRPTVVIDSKGQRTHLRGSDVSIGIIVDVKRSNAIVQSHKGGSRTIYAIKHLHVCNPTELAYARAQAKRYPNLQFHF